MNTPIKPSPSSGMNPAYAFIFGGGLGACAGAAAGHAAVWLTSRLAAGSSLWFKGPHGPPFFDLLLSTAFFYAGLGAGLYQGKRRLNGASRGFLTAFLVLLVPLAAATRIFSWGENPGSEPTFAWLYLVIGVYAGACMAATAALGARIEEGAIRWKPALGALFGALTGYLCGLGLMRVFPGLKSAALDLGPCAPPAALLDGALSGSCIALGIALTNITRRDPSCLNP